MSTKQQQSICQDPTAIPPVASEDPKEHFNFDNISEADLKLIDDFKNLLYEYKTLHALRTNHFNRYGRQNFGTDRVPFAIKTHTEYNESLNELIDKCYQTIVSMFQERIHNLFDMKSDEYHARLDDLFITKGRPCPVYYSAGSEEYEFRAIPLYLGIIDIPDIDPDRTAEAAPACLLIDTSVIPFGFPTNTVKLNWHVVFICQSLEFGRKLVINYPKNN